MLATRQWKQLGQGCRQLAIYIYQMAGSMILLKNPLIVIDKHPDRGVEQGLGGELYR